MEGGAESRKQSQSSDRPGPGPSVIVDGCDDPILFVHEAAMHLLQLSMRELQLTLSLQTLVSRKPWSLTRL